MLNDNHHLSWCINKNFKCIRLDISYEERGGQLLFLRTEVLIKKIELTDFETVYVQVRSMSSRSISYCLINPCPCYLER